MQFGRLIKRLREKADLTQAQACALVGANLRTWQAWEAGRHEPAALVRGVALLKLGNRSKK